MPFLLISLPDIRNMIKLNSHLNSCFLSSLHALFHHLLLLPLPHSSLVCSNHHRHPLGCVWWLNISFIHGVSSTIEYKERQRRCSSSSILNQKVVLHREVVVLVVKCYYVGLLPYLSIQSSSQSVSSWHSQSDIMNSHNYCC